MSINQAASKNFGNLCCRSWFHRWNRARKRNIGILLVTVGLIWVVSKAELLDFSWLHTAYFWPAVLILLGFWMVYKRSTRGISRTINNIKKEE